MSKKIVVAGSGFAGLWSAISAARAISLAGKTDAVAVIMVSPTSALTIRPRLYEAVLENMNPDIKAVLDAAGITHIAGTVERIDAELHVRKQQREELARHPESRAEAPAPDLPAGDQKDRECEQDDRGGGKRRH